MAKKKTKKIIKLFSFDKSFFEKENVLVLGLDISLTHSGIVVVDKNGHLVHREIVKMKSFTRKKKKYYNLEIIQGGDKIFKTIDITTFDNNRHEVKRIIEISKRVDEILSLFNITHVAMEGYAMGVKGGGRVFDIGELGGAVKKVLFEKGFDPLSDENNCYIIPPTSLKSYITGSGAAKKDEMMGVILRRYGISFEDDNEGDAFALCRLVLDLGEETKIFCKKNAHKIYREQKSNG